MRIVFSGNTSWGMYNFRINVMRTFAQLGFDVWVVAPVDEYTDKLLAAGLSFKGVKHLKRSGMNPVLDLILLKEYIGIYKELKPDFIFHYTIKPNIYGTFACKVCKVPCISITTGLGNAFSKNKLLFYFAKNLYKYSSVYASEIWFLNSNDLEVFVKNKIISKKKSFLLAGEGVDLETFKPSRSLPANQPVTYALISRMLYDKGVEVFVDATKILQKKGYNFVSLLIGQIDPGNPAAIELQTINKWQDAGIIKYLGSTTDVKPFIESSDCIVLPSFYKEGIPRILMEAAGMERPIITTRNPGCLETVDDGINGYLCEMNDTEDLALKMEKFIHLSSKEKVNLGKAGRKKMEAQFDQKVIISIYLKKLKQYLDIK